MSQLVMTKKGTTSQQSNLQKTFVRLRKKVERLEDQLEIATDELNQALAYYHDKIMPIHTQANQGLIQCVKLFYAFHQAPKGLSKKERKFLKELLCCQLTNLGGRIPFKEMDPEISKIHQEVVGCGYEEALEDEFSEMRSDLTEMLQDSGLDIDLSDIRATDNQEEIIAKFFQAMKDSGVGVPPEKKKTKKQLEKEKKAEELALLQKKGLAMIYKPLARALHPDLEQDPAAKVEKEALMKQLTHAYEEGDLHALLKIQGEWMDRHVEGHDQFAFESDAQMKVYNSILKDQIAELECQLDHLILHPRYRSIYGCFPGNYAPVKNSRPAVSFMRKRLEEEEGLLHLCQVALTGLQGPNPLRALRDILADFGRPQIPDSDMEELSELLDLINCFSV